MDTDTTPDPFVVVGGGIAGVTCAQNLARLCPDDPVLLVSATPLLKAVCNVRTVGKLLEEFDVEEQEAQSISQQYGNIQVVHGHVDKIDAANKRVRILKDGSAGHTWQAYRRMCWCAGGSAHTIMDHPHVLGIRDTDSVRELSKRLQSAQRVLLVGNGGIALELVSELAQQCSVVWSVKHEHIGNTFMDHLASEFVLPLLNLEAPSSSSSSSTISSRDHVGDTDTRIKPNRWTHGGGADEVIGGELTGAASLAGTAMGPHWTQTLTQHLDGNMDVEQPNDGAGLPQAKVEWFADDEDAEQQNDDETPTGAGVDLQLETQVESIREDEDTEGLVVTLDNGREYRVDCVVSATGVTPNTALMAEVEGMVVDENDQGVVVDHHMATSVQDIYAAGDACTCVFADPSPHWFQMRLWSQARYMGLHAARCMAEAQDEIDLDFCFELFAHVTRFFGRKLILLGLFNAQGLDTDQHELLVRSTPGLEYVKLVLQRGRVQGAMLLGDTDLEETMENLILNQLDVSMYGNDLLNPDIDLEDYFD